MVITSSRFATNVLYLLVLLLYDRIYHPYTWLTSIDHQLK